jgi:ABC-type transport system involved in multi-copper enzyme maturation permease subunit
MPRWLLVRYVLTAAVRDRVVLAIGALLLAGAGLAVFLGSAAVVESDRFALVFAGGGLRLAGAAGVVLLVVAHIRRAFEARDVEYLLARPLSRATFLASHAAAFALLALATAAAVTLVVLAVAPHLAGPGTAAWAAGLAAEYVVLAAAALFFAMVLPGVPAAAIATLGVYVLGRMAGQILGTIDGHVVAAGDPLARAMEAVSVLVPRLDLFAPSSLLVYGPDPGGPGLPLVAAQAAAFTALFLAAALRDLWRRDF